MEIFVVAGNVLPDPGIFQWTKEERNERINFLIHFMENSLNVPEGSFSFYKSLMGFAFHNVPEGIYGIRCFQDNNNNGKLDKDFFSPSEP